MVRPTPEIEAMKPSANAVTLLTVVFLAVVVTAAACGRADSSRSDGASAASRAGAAAGDTYPEPRWPSYFKPPKSVDDLMGAARSFVRNQSGLQGKGMGILAAGESVLIVAANDADPMVLEAIRRALVERKITPHMRFVYDMSGETRAQAEARQTAHEKNRDITKAGIYQASQWIENQFPNPGEPKAWLKQRRPEVYKELFPGEVDIVNDPAKRQRPRGEGAGGEDADTGATANVDYQSRNAVGEGI